MGGMKTKIKLLLQQQEIYIYRRPPRGANLAFDLRKYCPQQSFNILFDIGANVGQTTAEFLGYFPKARVWSFEPSGELYRELGRRFARDHRVVCENIALGSAEGEARLNHTSVKTMFHLANPATEPPPDLLTGEFESVKITTLDSYCQNADIAFIDFLKIDTEGHDLEVLRGAQRMLSEGKVAFVQCECGMNPENKFHRSFEETKVILERFGYRAFGFYEQIDEMFKQMPNLRRANVVFISPAASRREGPDTVLAGADSTP
jgi:FkbM family methyltransferase